MARPRYDDIFEPHRVPFGGVIDSKELGRRLCYELQIPTKYSTRVYKAFSRVISDAMSQGEGIRVQDLGVLKVKKYASDTVRLPDSSVVTRSRIFKLVFDTTSKGDKVLEKITKDYRALKEET
jgi:nucleoid DNA-binding protein